MNISLKSIQTSLLVLLLSVSLNCCTSTGVSTREVNSKNPIPLQDNLLLDELVRSDSLRLPGQYRLKQHIILTIFNRQFDFIGYLIKGTGSRFRALGFSEMGMKIFDLLYTEQKLSVISNSFNIPENPLKDGLSRDILHLFFNQPGEAVMQGYLTAEGFYLVQTPERQLYFNTATKELMMSNYQTAGKLRSEITYSNYKSAELLAFSLPYYIQVSNKKWHYTLDISLLEIEELADTGPMFQVR
jgi:hypothetical protein